MIANRRRFRLVVQITREGKAINGYFRVVGIHDSRAAANRQAIHYRRRSHLARVVRFQEHFIVAVRKPRKIRPASWMLR